MMEIKEWIANNIGYRFGGCFYAKTHDHIFNFISSLIPEEFKGRVVSDLGCGDGTNTFRIKKVFNAKDVVGYEKNDYLIKRARKNGLRIVKMDLDKKIPKGELAVFTFSLHHIKDKERCLANVKKNFKQIFLIEPCNDLYHRLLDAGDPISREDWIQLFDKVLGKYKKFDYKNNIIVFYSR